MEPLQAFSILFGILASVLAFAVITYKTMKQKLDEQVRRGAIFKPKDSSPWSNDQIVILEKKMDWVRYVSIEYYAKGYYQNAIECKVKDLLAKCEYAGIYSTK